ncbi:MAG: 50S ribosomal protein L17 [Bacteroidales bacterium]|nr:50S ribosomal protein L17 [Bacteroidales bacterium]
MRHRKKINHLGRQAGHRKAMLANMANSLILHKRITTTTAKAKALRTYVEPLMSKTKNLSTVEEKTHAQRVVFSYLQNKQAVKELFTDIAPKIETRPGGYTRILKTGTRLGDSADMCVIELVDYNENLLAAKDEAASKSGRRRRRSTKKGSEAEVVATEAKTKAAPAAKTETVVAENPAPIAEDTVNETNSEEKKEE